VTRKVLAVLFVAALAGAGLLVVPSANADQAPAQMGINTDPVLLTYSGPPPHGCPGNPTICYLPLPAPTLSLSARLREVGYLGGPAGEEMVFSIGAKPTEAKPQGTLPICRGVTDTSGGFVCEGGKASLAVLLAILGGGGWVSHPATAQYGFAVAQVPLIQQACDNPFC